jgi:GH18 family chitinase
VALGGAMNAAGSGGALTAGSGGALTAGTGGAAAGGAGGSVGMAGSGGAGPIVVPTTKVVMYLPNWNGSFASWGAKIDFTKMTHLNLAFGVIKNGTNDWSLGASDADVKSIAAAAHAKNVKVLVSIGGASDDIGIINRYQTEANVAPMVANLDAFVKRLDLDGVDVDVERGGSMKSSGNFPKFMSQLVAALHPEGKLVTAALAQYIMQAAGNDATVTAWTNAFDFINLMIYNKNMGTYTNELNWWKTNRGVPKTKLTWGVIFDGSTSVDMVSQLTTASKADGGIMAWELSLDKTGNYWKAVQGAL